MATQLIYWISAIFIIHLLAHHQIKAKLQAISPSFHTLTLQAKTKSQVTICENQPWQSHVCQTEIIHNDNPVLFKGLRMSTSYIISQFTEDGKLIDSAQVETKGFKVLATSCQKDETQVLVETGPFFGGYISLEQNGGTTKECKLRGDKSSRQTQYLFKILHQKCAGVRVPTNQTMQATLIVQEAWPILTASAKRFKLSCHFRASSFTVHAGLSMPSSNKTSSRTPKSNESLTKRLKATGKKLVRNNDSGFQFQSNWKSENDVSVSSTDDPISRYEELPQDNDVDIRASRLTTKDKPKAKNIFFLDGDDAYPTSHIILMVVLVISATVGSIATVIWIKNLVKERSQQMRVLWERKPEETHDLPNQDLNEERDYENVSFSFSSTLRLPKCLNEQNSSFV